MAAASNLALKINDLDPEWGPGDGPGQALREAYTRPAANDTHIIEQDEGLDLPSSTDPRILVPGKHDAAFQLRSMDPRAHGDVRQLLDALDGREIILLIRTQDSPTEMLKSLWTQMREQLPHDENYHYPFLMKEFASQVHGFAGRTGAGTVQLRLSSHGTPIESLSPEKSATFYQATAYDGDSRRDSALRKASLELTLGAASAGSVDPQKLAQEVQPEDGRPFLLLCLGADQTTDTMPMSDQMKLNKALVEREAYDTVYTSAVSAEVTPESLKAQEIENRVATIEMLSEWARHPEADPKVKSELVKQLGAAIKEISKPNTLAKLPVGVALAAAEALKDIAENHPVMADPEFVAPGKAIEMAIGAQKLQRVVVALAPEGALETLHITPANENTPLTPDQEVMATAVVEARIEQVKTLFEKLDAPEAAEQSVQLIDEKSLKAIEAQPVIPEGVKAKLADVQQKIEPLRRRSELKSEAPQLGELKAIDPKGTLKIEPKAQKLLQALQEQLKADPKLREELAKNKEIAPLLEALDKTDFAKPADVAKLAAQIAKLPSGARAEIAEKVAPVMPEAERASFKQEFTEVTEKITQAAAMEAIAPLLEAPILMLKDAALAPEQKEKLEAIEQQLAEATDPEAIREIVKQLNDVIAELPPEVMAEIPQLKEFAEITQKWESEPAAFDQFVTESTAAHADAQIAAIEQVEAVHLAADVGAKIELTLEALKELPLDGAQQAELKEIVQQMADAGPAELKEIIAKLDGMVKALPPEVSRELPPAIKEIQEGLKSADLSALKQVEIAPEVKAEIGAKLGLTLDALKEAPLKPAEQKQIQEIAKLLASDNPAEVRRAAKQLEKMMAALPPETVKQLPPALTELRETLQAAAQPRLSAAPRPLEFSAPVLEGLKKFQAAIRAAPDASGLPLTPRQLETLARADLSKPDAHRRVINVIAAAQSAPAILENRAAQPVAQGLQQQTPAQQQFQRILKLPEVHAQSIAREVRKLQSANAPPADIRAAIEQYGVSINQTMSSGNLHRIANDPSAPPALRMQAYMWYLDQLQREKKQQMEMLLAAQMPPQTQARQIAADLGNASSQLRDTRQELQMQAAAAHHLANTTVRPDVSGTAASGPVAATTIAVPDSQTYQSTAYSSEQLNREMNMAAGAVAAVMGAQEVLQTPEVTRIFGREAVPETPERFQPNIENPIGGSNPVIEEFKLPESPKETPESGQCRKDCGSCHNEACGVKNAYKDNGQDVIDKADVHQIDFMDPNISAIELPGVSEALKGTGYVISDQFLNNIPPDTLAAGQSYHAQHGYEGNPEDCPVVGELIKAQKKLEQAGGGGASGSGDTKGLNQPADLGNPPKEFKGRTRGEAVDANPRAAAPTVEIKPIARGISP